MLVWLFPEYVAEATALGADAMPLVLGRDGTGPGRLDGTEVSRKHAEIRRDGPLFIVRDLDSTNGVFLNGKRVTEAPLSLGDVLRVGEWVGAVVEEPAAATARSAHFRQVAPGLWGGPVLGGALDPLRRLARSDLPIIIEGETGTGKEHVARAIHTWSDRSGPLLALNCGALPASLAEGELFGYRKGAFTGADRASPGLFRAARGGTLLLDEIGDLPLSLQAKLLRVLEQREVLPLGESHPVPIDVRVVVATQQPLAQAVEDGSFRGDLFARLDGLTVQLPPLRARLQEIPSLARKLLEMNMGGTCPDLDPKLVEALCLYDWPFNVRELDLVCRRLAVQHGNERLLRASHLPDHIATRRARASRGQAQKAAPSAEAQEASIEALLTALRSVGGNVRKAAAQLGISRQRAYRLLESDPEVRLSALRDQARAEER